MEDNSKKQTAIVRKYNLLIDGRYTFTAQESRLVSELSILVDPKNDEHFKVNEFDMNYLAMKMKLDPKQNVINELTRVLKMLGGKSILVPDPSNPDILTLTPVLEKPIFDRKKGTVSLSLAKEFEPYLLEKRIPKGNGYTLIDTAVSSTIKQAYEVRFFEFFQRHLFRGGVYLAVHEKYEVFRNAKDEKPLMTVQHVLDIKAGQYKNFNNIKVLMSRIIESIKTRSGVNFTLGDVEYFKIKGRSYDYVYIPIIGKSDTDKFTHLSDKEVVIFNKIIALGVSENKAFMYIGSYFETDKERLDYHLNEAANKKNPAGWFIAGMEKQDCRPSPSLFSVKEQDDLKQKIDTQKIKQKKQDDKKQKLEIMIERKVKIEESYRDYFYDIMDGLIKTLSNDELESFKDNIIQDLGFIAKFFKKDGWRSRPCFSFVKDFWIGKYPNDFNSIADFSLKYKVEDWGAFLKKIELLEKE